MHLTCGPTCHPSFISCSLLPMRPTCRCSLSYPSHSLPCGCAYIKALFGAALAPVPMAFPLPPMRSCLYIKALFGAALVRFRALAPEPEKSNTKHVREEKHLQVSSRGARAILAVRTWSHILVLRSLSSICGAAYEKLCKMTYKTMLPDLIRGKYA